MEKITTVLAGIQSRLVAPKDLRNSHMNFKYRSCEGILNALKPLLAEAGAVVTMSDDIVEVGGRIYVKATATLICAGESISAVAFARESLSKKGLEDAQCSGMASSYSRKYALNGLFAIDDTKDADHGPPPQQQQRPQAPPPKKTRTTAERVAGAVKAYSVSAATHRLSAILTSICRYCWRVATASSKRRSQRHETGPWHEQTKG
jgi:hypothetical protein